MSVCSARPGTLGTEIMASLEHKTLYAKAMVNVECCLRERITESLSMLCKHVRNDARVSKHVLEQVE